MHRKDAIRLSKRVAFSQAKSTSSQAGVFGTTDAGAQVAAGVGLQSIGNPENEEAMEDVQLASVQVGAHGDTLRAVNI